MMLLKAQIPTLYKRQHGLQTRGQALKVTANALAYLEIGAMMIAGALPPSEGG